MDFLQETIETLYDSVNFPYWRWRLKHVTKEGTFRAVVPVLLFYVVAYFFFYSPARLFKRSSKSSPPLFLHFFSGILLLSASGLAVGYSARGNPAAFAYGAAGGASLFLSLFNLGDHRPIQALLRSIPLLFVLAASAIEAFKIPFKRVYQLLVKKGEFSSALNVIALSFVPPMPADWDGSTGSSYPPLQYVAGYSWVILVCTLILMFFIALPLRFKKSFPFGGPFSRSSFSGFAVASVIVLCMSIFHEIVRTQQQATLDDIETDKRRKVADLHFFVCAGYAVSALLVWAREASLSRLQLVTSKAVRGASVDLYALVVLALLIASVIFQMPTSLNERLTRLHTIRSTVFDALKGSALRLMKEANLFHGALFGVGQLPRPGDGSIGAGIILLVFSELLIDALSWSSLMFSPLVAEVTARGVPRLKSIYLTIDVSNELVSNASKFSSLLKELQKASAKATLFLNTEGFQTLAGSPTLSLILEQGHELGLLIGEGRENVSFSAEDEILQAESIANDVLKQESSRQSAGRKGKGTSDIVRTIRWVRPQDGSNSTRFLSAISSCGLSVALWSASVNCSSTQPGVEGCSLLTLSRQLGLDNKGSNNPSALESSSLKGAIIRVQNATLEGIKFIVQFGDDGFAFETLTL
jgi:hypothetical protein